MSGVATAIGAAAVVGAGASVYAGNKQAAASKNAANTQEGMFNTVVGNEAPYVQSGNAAQSRLNYLLGVGPNQGSADAAGGGYGSLNQNFNADTFKSLSPAYQFQLQQGAQGTLNQDTSAVGGLSGAALKDLTSFNQNFANTSFNNAFNQYQTQQNNTFNRLNSIAQTGQAAASNQATGGSSYAGGIGSNLSNVGGAQGSGAVGAANALGGGAANAALWAQYGGGAPAETSPLVGGAGGTTTQGGYTVNLPGLE